MRYTKTGTISDWGDGWISGGTHDIGGDQSNIWPPGKPWPGPAPSGRPIV